MYLASSSFEGFYKTRTRCYGTLTSKLKKVTSVFDCKAYLISLFDTQDPGNILPVSRVVLGRVSRRQRRHEPTDLRPNALVQVKVRCRLRARHDQWKSKQCRTVPLRRQEVNLLWDLNSQE